MLCYAATRCYKILREKLIIASKVGVCRSQVSRSRPTSDPYFDSYCRPKWLLILRLDDNNKSVWFIKSFCCFQDKFCLLKSVYISNFDWLLWLNLIKYFETSPITTSKWLTWHVDFAFSPNRKPENFILIQLLIDFRYCRTSHTHNYLMSDFMLTIVHSKYHLSINVVHLLFAVKWENDTLAKSIDAFNLIQGT